jgi:hypothetical protein
MDDTIIAEFAAARSDPDAMVTDPSTLAERGRDYWRFGGQPGLLVRPTTREEVVAVVRIAATHQISVVTRGGASNCAGAMMPNPHRVLIDLSTMRRILGVDPSARTARTMFLTRSCLRPPGDRRRQLISSPTALSGMRCVTAYLVSMSSLPTVRSLRDSAARTCKTSPDTMSSDSSSAAVTSSGQFPRPSLRSPCDPRFDALLAERSTAHPP